MKKTVKAHKEAIASQEVLYQYQEKEKRAAELVRANEELSYQIEEKKKRADELIIANHELLFQKEEKSKRAAELAIADKELAYQKKEKKKREAELALADIELVFQSDEKGKRAAELVIANKELSFQNEEKGKRATELIIANKELVFQNLEKERRASELVIANKELRFQNKEKEDRAAELIIANKELLFQNNEKEMRAAELIVANQELAYQNTEKEKRAAELAIANSELSFQNKEKEKRAAELVVANIELAFQNEEKEKRAAELFLAIEELKKAEFKIIELNVGLERKVLERTQQLEEANKELESFSYSVSHDLRSPLRAINGFTQVLVEDYADKFDEEGLTVIAEILANSARMGELIDNLLEFSHIGKQNISLAEINMRDMVEGLVTDLEHANPSRKIKVVIEPLENVKGDRNLLKQVFINLISNAFKYTGKTEQPQIEIRSYREGDQQIYSVRDNGAGFDMRYYDKLFGVFQRLHSNNDFEGTGVGLAIVQRIVTKHGGKVWAESKVNEGATFYVSLPGEN